MNSHSASSLQKLAAPRTTVAPRWSVQTCLIWLVVACLLPGIIGAFGFFIYEYREGRSQLERDTVQMARALVQAVDNQLMQAQALAQGLATDDSLPKGDFASFTRRAREALKQSQLGATVQLIDRDGRQIANTAKEYGEPLPLHGDPESIRRVFETGKPAVSNLYTGRAINRLLVSVAVPVVLGGNLSYVLSVSILPEQFNQILSAQRLPPGWVATILDGNTIIVSRSRDAERYVGSRPSAAFFDRFSVSREGTVAAVMKDGVSVHSAYSRSATTNWKVAVSIPQEALTARLMRGLFLIALGIASLFAIGLSVAWTMGDKISRSFRALVPPALALGAGEAVTPPLVEVREAADVAKALSEAAALLDERRLALRQSEIRLQTLTEHAPASIAVFDRDMRYLAVSQRWRDDYNLGARELIGVSHYDIFPEIPQIWREAHRRGLAGEVLHADTDRLERGDGTVQWLRWELWPWYDDTGAVGGIVVATEDITERVSAEERTRASEAKYRTLFANMTEGFILGEPILDAQGNVTDVRFLEVNEAFHVQTGIRHGCQGHPFREVLPNLEQSWIDRYSSVALSGQATRFESFNADTNRYYDVYAFSPAPGLFASLFRDITEQKGVQRALQDSEAYLRQLITTLPGMVWTATPDGALNFMSQYWLDYTGTTLESQLGNGAFDCLHPDDRDRTYDAWRAAVGSQTILQVQYRLRRHDGQYRWFYSRCAPIRNKDGTIARWLGVVTDIDDLKRAQEALEDSEQRYRALFNNKTNAIAHCSIVADEYGHPVDYRIEAVNEAYERTLGVTREQIEGKLVTEAFPGVRDFALNFIEEFGRIGLEGGEGHFEMYFPPSCQWLSLYAYSYKRGECTAIFTDITHQKEIETALRQSEESYRTLFEVMNEGFAICEIIQDDQGRPWDYRHLLVNPAFERLGGYAPGSVNGKTARELSPLIEPYWIEMFGRVALTGEPESREDYTVSVNKWFSARAFSLHGRKFAYLFTDITERKLAEQRVREAALHDALTGLPNRALVFEFGGHLLAAAQRSHGRGALLFIDLDRFKPINDLYGHEVGDRVLQEVARRLVDHTRHEDLVGRLGGDEFVIFVPQLDGIRDRAAIVAQHVIESICQPIRAENLELSVSPSIGIAYYPEHATDVGALIHCADLAMYQVKQAGRASYRFYTPELDRQADDAYVLEERLKNALRHSGLKLHYQPVVDIRSGRLIGAEALVRLDDGGKMVGPGSFIPIAESAGLIGELGEWVTTEACRQHEEWLREGLQVTIAINVSPLQFRQRDFSERLSKILSDSGVDPTCLQLEVTEGAVMESLDEAVMILNRIKSLGVKVALDDFGTGYSSLSRLSSLPLDKLKVDQSFVQKIENDQASRSVTEAIIALGRSLKLEVIGEGIESENALRYLREQGCDQAQGYWFSRPLSAPEFARWCREQQVS